MRIVSLLPSLTELVYELGLGKFLVGRSHACIYPPAVRKLPVLTSPQKLEVVSANVLASPEWTLQATLSSFSIDTEALKALKPDVILTQDQCAVCAVEKSVVEQVVQEVLGNTCRVISFHANTLDEVFSEFERIGTELGVRSRAQKLVQQLQKKLEHWKQKFEQHEPIVNQVVLLEWLDPLLGSGHWIPELLEYARLTVLFGNPGGKAPILTWYDLEKANPDAILYAPCGYSLEEAGKQLLNYHQVDDLRTLRAFKAKRIFVVDGCRYFSCPGPHLLDSLPILAEMFYPDFMRSEWIGKAWTIFY